MYDGDDDDGNGNGWMVSIVAIGLIFVACGSLNLNVCLVSFFQFFFYRRLPFFCTRVFGFKGKRRVVFRVYLSVFKRKHYNKQGE